MQFIDFIDIALYSVFMIWKKLKKWIKIFSRLNTDEQEVKEIEITDPPHAFKRSYQSVDEGVGDLFHRTYQVHIVNSKLSAKDLMKKIQSDINWFVPSELAEFQTTEDTLHLQIDKELHIAITGPWNGPVRVSQLDDHSFTFVTIDGHLEAGHIVFKAEDHLSNEVYFQIESWAKSQDWLIDIAYDKLKVAKIAQTSMWSFFCQRIIDATEGQLKGEINVSTEKTDNDTT